VDESMLTGEAFGAKQMRGSLCSDHQQDRASLRIQRSGETALAQIIRLVERLRAQRLIQRFADRVASVLSRWLLLPDHFRHLVFAIPNASFSRALLNLSRFSLSPAVCHGFGDLRGHGWNGRWSRLASC
jgi:cation transport ATPase